jgi:arginine-tRNA-protein transferase
MLCPQTRQQVCAAFIVVASAKSCREKRRLRGCFDLSLAVHKVEYGNISRPKDKRTGDPIEPAHKFEVNLEGDSFTKEK